MLESIIECIKNKIEKNRELRDELYSLILYGSFVRGDFIEGVSDLDFFAVIKDNEKVIASLKIVLEECCANLGAVEIDLAWEYLENLDDPLHKGFPFKFLTIYQQDFLEHHVVIYGDDITSLLPRYYFKDLLKWRIERLLASINKFSGNLKMLHIGAGEVVRLLALIHGARSLRKKEVLRVLEIIGDIEALEIYRAYLNGRELRFSEDYLKEFVRSRCEILKKQQNL
ncbi:nucleotidyltransferase [Thermococcus sp. EP1]|uniref:nucleotidyltransferase domain-containing protein n=1 Tax=Thermococcus sp. EP1 TaxID=1591054 RepID=UPI0006DBA296|nr:nucleotidyltransferase domain-containing protein [Thermococcus sp. EP1]KPU62581.1 nucleotidyltransferase [Thermococcus sp. EP1]